MFIQNNKDFEKTLNMFLCGEVPKAETKMTIVETQSAPKKRVQEEAMMIDTGGSAAAGGRGPQKMNKNDAKSYVLDEFKEILFPK